MSIRKKYKKERADLIEDIKKKRKTALLSLEVVATSKIKGHFIYECVVLDNGKIKTVPVIAIDGMQALGKLEPHLNMGLPESTLKYILGNERINGVLLDEESSDDVE